MKKQKIMTIFFILFLLIITGCHRKEVSIILDLNEKLKAAGGNAEEAKKVLKNYLDQETDTIRKAVSDFMSLGNEDKQNSFLEFNNQYYDTLKNTLFKYKYLENDDFKTLYELFIKEMGPLLGEEKDL
ncbi:MAG TPA: hypothetical protein DHW82_09950 [Spirochaetia bacterium]|nr:MAG: hypothetical protein A2Y41_06300 [Spirochaetes bacterium GWB1_36_13]HCL57314.1 hypothetical protein [Spirochaetia bacterium]